jgi:hypothetical protein
VTKNRTLDLGLWQPLTEIFKKTQESLKIKKPGGKVRLARRADNLAAIY